VSKFIIVDYLLALDHISFSGSELESKEGAIIGLDAGGGLEQVDEALSLSGEAVDDVLLVVGGWGLEEEAEVGEDWAHGLVVDLHPGEQLAEDDHIDHQGSGEERVLTNVVGGNGVGAVHEDAAGVLVEGALRVLHEGYVLDDNLVVDVVVAFGVQNRVGLDGIVENAGLGNLLGLEALVFLKVLAVVVTEMVVGDNGGESDTGADEEVRHHGLEPGLAGLEVRTAEEGSFLLGVLDDTWVECVLWRTVQVKHTLLDGSDAVDD